MGQGEYPPNYYFFFALLTSFLQKTARVRACLGCQQARAKCQVGGPRTIPQKRMREEEGPEEGSSRQTWVRRSQDMGSKGGVDIGLLLEGVRSALKEQMWLMRQMCATHTAIESELRLLHHSAEYTFNCICTTSGEGSWGSGDVGRGRRREKGRSAEL